jgi:hypothetical protein
MIRLAAGLFLTATALATAPAADDFKPEPGFNLLFTGESLDGWKLKGDALDGKTDAANKRFTVKDAALVIDPKVKGDLKLETAKEFDGDVHLKFDFRPGAGCNNDVFFRGTKFDLKKADLKAMKEGEWNAFEIVVTGDTAEFLCNGESVKKMKVKAGKAPLGIRAEFGPVEIRRVRVKEGK